MCNIMEDNKPYKNNLDETTMCGTVKPYKRK